MRPRTAVARTAPVTRRRGEGGCAPGQAQSGHHLPSPPSHPLSRRSDDVSSALAGGLAGLTAMFVLPLAAPLLAPAPKAALAGVVVAAVAGGVVWPKELVAAATARDARATFVFVATAGVCVAVSPTAGLIRCAPRPVPKHKKYGPRRSRRVSHLADGSTRVVIHSRHRHLGAFCARARPADRGIGRVYGWGRGKEFRRGCSKELRCGSDKPD